MAKNKNKQKNNSQSLEVKKEPKKIVVRNTFVKDLKSIKDYPEYKKNADKLDQYVDMIARGEPLPVNLKNHKLAPSSPGELSKCRSFHLETDIVVIYRNDGPNVELIHIGKHSKTRMTSSLER